MGRFDASASRGRVSSPDRAQRRAVAIVTPHFWPLINDRSLHLLRLSEAFHDAGCEVTVVTPRWTRNWPTRVALGKVNVHRLPGNATGGLGLVRWLYALGRWLQSNPRQAVVVAGLQREAQVTLNCMARRDIPTLLLASESDLVDRPALADEKLAAACQLQALAIVAPHSDLASALTGGCLAHKITVIPRSATTIVGRTADSRKAARLSLAAANYDLATADNSLVALAVGRLDEQHRQGDLVRAWRIVTARRPEAKLWIVGDGPERNRLYQQVGDLDQRFRVMLPGMFERHDELLAAADLLVVPACHQVAPVVLHDALAAGLPAVVAEESCCRQLVADRPASHVFPQGDIQALATAVLQACEQPSGGGSAPPTAAVRTSAEEAAEYLALLDRLQSSLTETSQHTSLSLPP